MIKRCPQHGVEEVLVADDIEYYKSARDYCKPSQKPLRNNTSTRLGCPYDCGLCPDHEQHSCVSVIELTDRCQLSCPTCYAVSGPGVGRHRSLSEIEFMLDTVIANEGTADVIQLSGGEPTLHPQFFEVIRMVRERPVKHLMINTNGLRIAQELSFVKRLAEYKTGLEVYLQFDSLREESLVKLRGQDLREVRRKSLEHLNEFGISTTLVVTLQKGVNSDEIGSIIEFALQQPCVRGITFQPTQVAGRTENFNPALDRMTLSEVRRAILEQHSLFKPQDIIPVPCHPEAIAMAYALKWQGGVRPLSDWVEPRNLLNDSGNTITIERDPELKRRFFELFSTGTSPGQSSASLQSLLCCLPAVENLPLSYENVFRIIIMQFYDKYSFDLRPIKKTCVHIVNPDGRVIPFDTMNIFYRDPEIMREVTKGMPVG